MALVRPAREPAITMAKREAASRGGVLLVANLPAGPLVGGVEVGVEMLLDSELRARHSIRLFNTDRRRDPNRGLSERLSYQARRFAELLVDVARHRPRLVHVKATIGINFWQGIGYCVLARLLGRRVLLQLHGGDFDIWYGERGRFVRWAVRQALRAPSELLVLSDYWRSFVGNLQPRARIRVVPNGVRLEAVRPRRRADDGALVVLTIGALGVRKGYFDILDAAARLGDEPVRFVFAGTDEFGGEEADLRERAQVLGVESRVELVGAVVGEAKWQLLADSDVFLLPSRAENMPNAVLEAMATGLPLVCTPVGAVREMAEDGALFVPVGDGAAIADAIRELCRSRERRTEMGRANRMRVESKFAFSAVAQLLDSIYREDTA